MSAKNFFLGCCLYATVLGMASPLSAQAGLFDGPVDRLPVQERVSLRKGKVILTGENGQYEAKVLVTATPKAVWSVLTDYPNYPKFLPGVISSKVLKFGNQGKTIEQVSERQVFVLTVRSRILYTTTETDQSRIDFQLVEGDLAKMQGYWQLDPVAPYPGAKPNQVLLTHRVSAEPPPGAPNDVFNDVYKSSLEETLTAIQREVGRRL